MRLLLTVIGVVSVFIAPWWVVGACAFLLALRWRAWEVVALGALLDIVWFPGNIFWGVPVATVAAILLVWILEPLRNELLVDQPSL